MQFMDLPPELADNVLACVADAPDASQTLGACALVCHSWRQLAYPYLFKTMRLNFSLADASLIKESCINVKTVEQIVDFFTSSPLVGPCIRTLQLRQVLKHQAVPADTFRRILGPLRRLQRLSLYNLLLTPSAPTPPSPPLPCSLDFLEIYTGEMRVCGDYLVTSKEIHDITRVFARVDHLCLSMLPTAYREERPEDLLANDTTLVLPAVRQLSVINPSSFDLLFRALRHMPTCNLRTINFENLPARDLEHVGRFLGTLGSTLESVKLGEVWSTNPHSAGELLSAMHTLNLSSCHALDNFTFTIPFTLATNVPDAGSTPITAPHWRLSLHTFSVVREILTTVIPGWTRSVGLVLRKNSMYERYSARIGLGKGEMSWKGLDEVLVGRGGMRKDACVRVEVVCDGWTNSTMVRRREDADKAKEGEREALKACLSDVVAAGMLRF
ncbi:hypothetical protein BDY19DRAFT_997666 [Irpex rosettiformis]|uniref:Uncharacterized protein n=1 Tax=Irpex rosettiformis TaxID=378272 RepID=A0ACB8TQW2_9APHY|nr:hypothetical protein BDY19DRAFT_997666 [Irpex rosettiformis]